MVSHSSHTVIVVNELLTLVIRIATITVADLSFTKKY